MKSTAKEIARSMLYKAGLTRIVEELAGRDKMYLSHRSVADRFAQIYRDGVWQRGNASMPLSGEGSTVSATKNLRKDLPKLLQSLGTRRLLDIGCGDFNWMSRVDLPGIEYIGADIVPEVVKTNQEQFGRSGRMFIVADGTAATFPHVDTILCREVLFHLSFRDTKSLLSKAVETGAVNFLLTTDSATKFNSDILSGDFRVLNLCAAPFRLPQPETLIREDASFPGRALAFWSRRDIVESVGAMAETG